MNLATTNGRRHELGIMLLEAIVYVSVLALILGLSLATFYTANANYRDLSRNADDITRTLKAGERWRADVRGASGPPRLDVGASVTNAVLSLPSGTNEIVYTLRDGELTRRGAGETNRAPFLSGLARSEFICDARSNVTVWRWEVELEGRQKVARSRPLFTFQAAEPKRANP
jgi:hypothetical protein